MPINKAQSETIEYLRSEMKKFGRRYGGFSGYEFKMFNVEEIGHGTLSLVAEVGSKTDEGTAAALFCRDHWHLFIGPRGGISCYAKSKRGDDYIKITGWEAFYRGMR